MLDLTHLLSGIDTIQDLDKNKEMLLAAAWEVIRAEAKKTKPYDENLCSCGLPLRNGSIRNGVAVKICPSCGKSFALKLRVPIAKVVELKDTQSEPGSPPRIAGLAASSH